MERTEEAAVRKLLEFFAAMREWERQCGPVYGRVNAGNISVEEAKARLAADLRDVFGRHTQTTTPKRLDGGGLSFGSPAEYDPASERVTDVSLRGDTAVVMTRKVGGRRKGFPPLEERFVYTLAWNGNEWRLMDDRQRIEPDGTLKRWDL